MFDWVWELSDQLLRYAHHSLAACSLLLISLASTGKHTSNIGKRQGPLQVCNASTSTGNFSVTTLTAEMLTPFRHEIWPRNNIAQSRAQKSILYLNTSMNRSIYRVIAARWKMQRPLSPRDLRLYRELLSLFSFQQLQYRGSSSWEKAVLAFQYVFPRGRRWQVLRFESWYFAVKDFVLACIPCSSSCMDSTITKEAEEQRCVYFVTQWTFLEQSMWSVSWIFV